MKHRGFTLVELMVVIAIMGILSSIMYANFNGTKAKSRDDKRVSDMGQLQLALEQYFNKNDVYPDGTQGLGALSPDFISVIPTDPSTRANYDYVPSDDKYDFVLHAHFEGKNSAVKDGLVAVPPSGYSSSFSFTCSNADTSQDYCVSSK